MPQYYLRHRQRVLGRYSADQLRAMADAGKLTAWHTVSADRQTWVPASQWESIDSGLSAATDFSINGDKLSSDSARFQLEAVETESPAPAKIKVVCDCGKAINAPAKYLNKRVKCSQCGQSVLVVPNSAPSLESQPEDGRVLTELRVITEDTPQKITKSVGKMKIFGAFSPKSLQKKLVQGAIGAAALLLIVIFAVWLIYRDTWERDHKRQIVALYHEAETALAQGNKAQGCERYEMILDMVDERQLTDARLKEIVATAKRRSMEIPLEIAAELTKREADRAEAERKAKEEADAKAAKEAAERAEAERKAQKEADAKAAKEKEFAERAEAEHKAQEEAEAKAAKEAADRAEAERKAQEEAEAKPAKGGAERTEAEYERNKNKEFLIKVMVMVDAGGNSPNWAADYELRINGKTVETQTTKSTIATFENIAAKDGDVITVRSGWKNGYGAVLSTYGKIKDGEWPKVKYGKTSYLITIKGNLEKLFLTTKNTKRHESKNL